MISPVEIWKAWAHSIFRLIAFFFLAFSAAAIRDEKLSEVCFLLIVAIDIASQSVVQAAGLAADTVYARQWHDTLTNRFFYEKLIEAVRAGRHVDVDEMFKEATVAARADIKIYDDDQAFKSELGGFSKAAISIWTFVWQWLRFGCFYGAAYALGHVGKF